MTRFCSSNPPTYNCDGNWPLVWEVFLAMAGEKGKRAIPSHARYMIHPPSGGASGMASDVEIQYKELHYWKETLTDIYVEHTGVEQREDC